MVVSRKEGSALESVVVRLRVLKVGGANTLTHAVQVVKCVRVHAYGTMDNCERKIREPLPEKPAVTAFAASNWFV